MALTPNPVREKRDLAKIFAQSNPANLFVRGGISGEIQLRASDPAGVLPDAVVAVQPADNFAPDGRQYDLLGFAPIAFWRESATLLAAVENGWLFVDLASSPGSPAPVQVALVLPPIPANATMATNESTDSSTFVVIGGLSFDPGVYVEIRFVSLASVTGSGLTGEIQLFNLTDSLLLVTDTFAGDLSPTRRVSGPLVLPAGQKVYEVRARVTGGTPPTDRVLVTWAGFETLVTEQ